MNQKLLYTPIDQKPYCCVPACILMILERRKIPYSSQDEIGYELGLTVPQEEAHLFTKVRTGKKPDAGWGTQVGKRQYSINTFFKKSNIKLKEHYFFVPDISDIEDFIISNLRLNNDIIVCFNNQRLHGEGDWGHVSLIQSIEGNAISLVDPEKDVQKVRKVKLHTLVGAMVHHGRERCGGFWVISEK